MDQNFCIMDNCTANPGHPLIPEVFKRHTMALLTHLPQEGLAVVLEHQRSENRLPEPSSKQAFIRAAS